MKDLKKKKHLTLFCAKPILVPLISFSLHSLNYPSPLHHSPIPLFFLPPSKSEKISRFPIYLFVSKLMDSPIALIKVQINSPLFDSFDIVK